MSDKYIFCTNSNCRKYKQYFAEKNFTPINIINDVKIILKQGNGEYKCRLRWGSFNVNDTTCETIEMLNNQSKLLKKLGELLDKDKVELEDTGE
jgi:hypothetical protein